MRACVAILAVCGLSACQTGVPGEQSVAASPPQAIPVCAQAGPGSRTVTVPFATDVVRKACVDTRPTFAGTPAALSQFGDFVQNAQTKTYYNQRYDLSVKLISGQCSVVMGGNFDLQDRNAIAGGASQSGLVSAGLPRQLDGRTYLSFSVAGV
ncbi:hypothetical protein [Tateyamaria sp. SN3-11]|uniref:hypothetical protein n=1 Tax=Tateyamaria sp. SN3-11 TaxID=3092147 RepID=UPI0039ED5DBA